MMQTKKKVLARNASGEQTNARSGRQQKKVTVITERKVTELITSSTKKQKNVRIPRKNRGARDVKDLNTSHDLSHDENEGVILAFESSFDNKLSDDRAAHHVLETIFSSPAFHVTKDVCGGLLGKGTSTDISSSKDQLGNHDSTIENSKIGALTHNAENRTKVTPACAFDTNTDVVSRSSEDSDEQDMHSHKPRIESNNENSSVDEEYTTLGNLSSEVSAIYLAMQHSKLECIDEPSRDSIPVEGSVESDEDDDFDDFDPYLFIKNLPCLSSIVPTFRPTLLPKQTRSCPSTTLVLDLDETLVHSTLEPVEDADFTFPVNFNLNDHTIYVRCRPFLMDFMERVAGLFEIIIFTASQSIYAERLLNVLDPKRKLFRHRVYRDSCVYVEGNYLKDLSVLGRDLSRVIIVDNSPQAFGFQVDNGIPIESWFDDQTDRELLSLLPFLESLVAVEDVRPMISKKFNLREKIEAAACLPAY